MPERRTRAVLITGAAVRIGRAIALAFARSGARVALHYRRSGAAAAALMRELEACGPGHVQVQADLLQASERDRLIPELLEAGFPLDSLVNNASVYRRAPLIETDSEQFRRDYEINCLAPLLLMRDFARHCGRGVIINLLDQRVAGVDPGAGTYALAKKSLRDATEAAAVEWAPRIRVNAVAAGVVLPPPGASEAALAKMIDTVPLRRRTTPEQVADACLFLAGAATVTGQILYVDGGQHLTGVPLPELKRADYSGAADAGADET